MSSDLITTKGCQQRDTGADFDSRWGTLSDVLWYINKYSRKRVPRDSKNNQSANFIVANKKNK